MIRALRIWGSCLLCLVLLLGGGRNGFGEAKKPGPFTFVYGLDSGGTPDDLKAFGVNTLYVDLQPDEAADLGPVRQQIAEASAAGYHVIVGIPTTSFETLRVSPYSEAYVAAVCRQIDEVVTVLRDEPGVSAWATGHRLEKFISYRNGDFQQFLQMRYGSLESLNQHWNVLHRTWTGIREASALELASDETFGFGRPAVDAADYRVHAFEQVMQLWARRIKALDSSRPLLTGCITLYSSIVAVPPEYDVIVVSMPPDIISPNFPGYGDHVTHNVEAVDMARRGGRFEVIPVLRLPVAGQPGYAGGLRDWVLEAHMHGACGVGLENWQRFADHPGMRRHTLEPLAEAWAQVDFSAAPRPTAAIIYSPYAEGYQIAGRPLYGHIKGFGNGEPSNLIHSLRMGTCFGLIDYLTADDLESAELDRYGVIIAPAALGVSEEQCRILGEYVKSGGALLGDLGMGLQQTGSWLHLTAPLQGVFGIRELVGGERQAGRLSVAGSVAELPHVKRGMRSSGTFRPLAPGGGSGAGHLAHAYSIGSNVAMASLTGGCVPLAIMSAEVADDDARLFSGLMCNDYGRGLGIFATHLLYSHWPLSDGLSTALHYDLMLRRADCELVDAPFLPEVMEVSVEAAGVRVLNGGSRELTHRVALYGQGDRLVADVVTMNRAGYTAGEERQEIAVTLAEHSTRFFAFTQIVAQPYDAEVSAIVVERTPQRVELVVAGPGAVFAPSRGRPYRFTRPESSVRVRFAVFEGGVYAVPAGSRHTVTVISSRNKTRRLEVVARGGAVTFTEEIVRGQVVIEPAR